MNQNQMKMQTPTLPKFETSIFEKLGFGKIRNRDTKTKILTCKEFRFAKNKKSASQNSKFDHDFDFLGQNLISKISKSISLISLEFRFETPKFEFSDVENHRIYIFASKFKFFFCQNLDFVLGRLTPIWRSPSLPRTYWQPRSPLTCSTSSAPSWPFQTQLVLPIREVK